MVALPMTGPVVGLAFARLLGTVRTLYTNDLDVSRGFRNDVVASMLATSGAKRRYHLSCCFHTGWCVWIEPEHHMVDAKLGVIRQAFGGLIGR